MSESGCAHCIHCGFARVVSIFSLLFHSSEGEEKEGEKKDPDNTDFEVDPDHIPDVEEVEEKEEQQESKTPTCRRCRKKNQNHKKPPPKAPLTMSSEKVDFASSAGAVAPPSSVLREADADVDDFTGPQESVHLSFPHKDSSNTMMS